MSSYVVDYSVFGLCLQEEALTVLGSDGFLELFQVILRLFEADEVEDMLIGELVCT